ncbi:IgGFc-binding protein [Labilithrix luteola]|uniref:IgGFc-binding protein n=1 Tax=Labilithrix luteola TaxID=1391654 RepID=UPI0011BA62CE|nr:IgGFc-binding protein [Labilithrix luteola]
MRTTKSLFGSIVVLTLGTIAFAACNSRDGFEEDKAPGLGGDAGTLNQCTSFRCSPDLKSVLATCDGGEEVVQTCPAEQGCGDGKCVDACESAKLSKGSIGCSFWTLPPDSVMEGRGACYAAMVANTWDRPVNLSAEYGNAALDISKSIYTAEKSGQNTTYTLLSGPLPPGQVALVFLSQAESSTELRFAKCPDGVVPAIKADPIRHGTTSRSSAFHLVADAPVAAYSIFPYGGADSMYPTATLLLPVSSWDTRYIAVSTSNLTRQGTPGTEPRTLQIVANEDATTVTIKPTVSILQGEDVAPARFGESGSWTLARGQVLQISQADNTSGSPILADKPVGVFGGSSCAFLPGETMFCDLTQQQLAPFSQWGTQYALVPYETRIVGLHGETPAEQVAWGFVGAASGTVLTYEPSRPRGAPETLEAGQAVSFFTDQIVTVKSQDDKHPFHAAVYMTGSQFNGGLEGLGRTLGDPDFVNVVPTDQFLDRYVFFTDYTYPETSLTVVRRKTTSGFLPVELDCAGEISGFQPLGTSGEFEYAWVRLTSGFSPRTFAKGTCGYGRHEAKSQGTFSLTVWGTARDASYGYAGGMGSRPVNSAPLPTVK